MTSEVSAWFSELVRKNPNQTKDFKMEEIVGGCVYCHDTHNVTELFVNESGQIVCGDHLVIPEDCKECGEYLESDNLEQIDSGLCGSCISRDYHESMSFDMHFNR